MYLYLYIELFFNWTDVNYLNPQIFVSIFDVETTAPRAPPPPPPPPTKKKKKTNNNNNMVWTFFIEIETKSFNRL
jgi:hypothetical protein